MTAYNHLGYKKGDLPNTELAATQIFSLPMYPYLTNEEVNEVCKNLKAILTELD